MSTNKFNYLLLWYPNCCQAAAVQIWLAMLLNMADDNSLPAFIHIFYNLDWLADLIDT